VGRTPKKQKELRKQYAMATKTFETKTVESRQSVIDDKLKPTSEIHILVGGPYTDATGEEHRYGHTALRVKMPTSDKTYDFGRYGRITGTFGESGEGILRVWGDFQSYISGEVALKRKTTGFVYAVFDHEAQAANDYFDGLVAAAKELPKSTPTKKVFRLATDYHALGPNCTTLSIDGAKKALPQIDSGSAKYNKPEAVLTMLERAALAAKGGAPRLFLPANLQTFLQEGQPVKPIRIDVYGSGK
jgi:hypothetical protein